ncbi:MAG TPA: hypothetical protein VML54_12075, partial [Candidatus Limnocylindrales bacterium]|nr:hypothetical protein [Candidatus Limnocylindrales bacterium]
MFALVDMLPGSPLFEIAREVFPDVLDAVEVLDAVIVVVEPPATMVFDPAVHAGLDDEDVEDPNTVAADDLDLAGPDPGALPSGLAGATPPADSGAPGPPQTSVSLRIDARVFDRLVIPIPGFELASLVVDTQDVVAEAAMRADGYQIALQAALRVRVDGAALRPMRAIARADGTTGYERDENRPHAEIVVAAARVTLDSSGSVAVDLGLSARFDSPLMVGDTGVIVEAEDIALVLQADPALQVGRARIVLPPDLPLEGVVVGLDQARLDARGFSGGVSLDLPLAFDETAGRFEYLPADAGGTAQPATLFGLSGGLRHLAVAIEDNCLTGSDITGALLIPYFEEPVDVRIAMGAGGDLAVTLSAADADGITLRKEELLALTIRSLTVAKEGDVGLVRATGGLAPLVMSGDGLQWPRLDVTDLEIDSQGRFRIREAWLELEGLATLDLFGFHFELARIGLGYEEPPASEPAGRLWVDLSGSLRLIEQIPMGLAVEGFRLSWPENLDAIVDLDGPPTVQRALDVLGALRVKFDGIHLFFGVPDAVEFEGLIRFFKEASAVGFAGDVALRVPASGFALEAGLLVGMSFEPPPFPFLYVYFGVELPAGVPLGQSGLALKGAKGLFGLNVSPAKAPEANWFHDWYKLPPEGAHPTPKWGVERSALAFGAGLTVSTADGYVKGVRGLLVLSLPGPILVIEGKALILSALTGGEPPFGALAVFDGPQRTVQFNIEAQAELVEDMLEAHGGLEAFFDFVDLTNWHLYLGEDAPADRRVQANILKLPGSSRYLFDASGYLMLDMVGEHTLRSRLGFLVGLRERFDEYDPFVIAVDAAIEGDGEVTVFPEQLSGEVELEASVEVSAFGVGVQLAASAAVLAEAPEPFRVEATLTVTADMPAPADDFETELHFEWEAPPQPTPVAPLVGLVVDSDLSPRGGAIELAGGDILRDEDDRSGIDVAARLEAEDDRLAEGTAQTRAAASPPVLLDARPTLLFGHDMNDATGADFGRDPDGTEHAHRIGRLRLEPSLAAVALYAHDKAEPWTDDFATDWQLVASSRPATGTDRLWGVWLADAAPENPVAPAVRRLRLWTANPFVHARRGLGTGYQKILGLPGPRLGYAQGFVHDHPDYFECRPIELAAVCVDFADAAKPPAEGEPGRDGVARTPMFTHEGLALTAVATLGPGPDGRPCLAVRGRLHVRFPEPVMQVRVDFGGDPRLEAIQARGRVTASHAPAGEPAAPCDEAVPFELEVDGTIWIISAPAGLDCLELVRPAPVAEICFVTREEAARAERAEAQC